MNEPAAASKPVRVTAANPETGAVKVYANPSGTLASAADTSAF